MAAVRRADATWRGDLATGQGQRERHSSSGVFKGLDVSWAQTVRSGRQRRDQPRGAAGRGARELLRDGPFGRPWPRGHTA